MNTPNTPNSSNLTLRSGALAVSTFAVIAAMESGLPGSTWFAVVNGLAIALAAAAIIGWNPLRSIPHSAEKAGPGKVVGQGV